MGVSNCQVKLLYYTKLYMPGTKQARWFTTSDIVTAKLYEQLSYAVKAVNYIG